MMGSVLLWANVVVGSTWLAQWMQQEPAASLPAQQQQVLLLPLDGGPGAQRHRTQTQVTPASLEKLLTTWMALELLGPSFQWTTSVLAQGQRQGQHWQGDLYLNFTGDPVFSEEGLWKMLRDIRAQGIQTIDGDWVLDGRFFAWPEAEALHFPDRGSNPHAPYLSLPSPYLINYGLHRIQLGRDAQLGMTTWVTPPTLDVNVRWTEANVANSACNRLPRPSWSTTGVSSRAIAIQVQNTLPMGCDISLYGHWQTAEQYAQALVGHLWAELGGELRGQVRLANAQDPEPTRQLAVHNSPTLSEVIRQVNKWSNNVVTRQLYINLGARRWRELADNDLAAAQKGSHLWLSDYLTDAEGLFIDNGAGLSRESRISPEQLGQALLHMRKSRYFPELQASMPLIAQEGTVHNRWRNTSMVGQGRLKTGRLNGINGVAGFVDDHTGRSWLVVLLISGQTSAQGWAWMEKLLLDLHQNPPPAERE